MRYLSRCNIRGAGCICSKECVERLKDGSTTPAWIGAEVAQAIKLFCQTPYYVPASRSKERTLVKC